MTDTHTLDLLPCPFCGKRMMFRKALHVSDGNVDAVIHGEPTECGLSEFTRETTDESILAAWNTRAQAPALLERVKVLEEALKSARYCVLELCQGQHPDNECWNVLAAVDAALASEER